MPEPIPVTLREDFTWRLEEMPAAAVSLLILQLMNLDFTANDQEVFKELSIDMKTRREAMAEELVSYKPELSGKELRFLRKELQMSQARLALILGNTAQSVAGWEIKKGFHKVYRAARHSCQQSYRMVWIAQKIQFPPYQQSG